MLTSNYSTVSDQQPAEAKKGNSERKEFQAETRMLLDIVARSLYSDKEVSIAPIILSFLNYYSINKPLNLRCSNEVISLWTNTRSILLSCIMYYL